MSAKDLFVLGFVVVASISLGGLLLWLAMWAKQERARAAQQARIYTSITAAGRLDDISASQVSSELAGRDPLGPSDRPGSGEASRPVSRRLQLGDLNVTGKVRNIKEGRR